MGEINICNQAGRDASVNIETIVKKQSVRWLDNDGRQASTIRVLKAPLDRGIDALTEREGDVSSVGKALVDGDPEIDFENAGRYLVDTSRVYINQAKKLVHKIQAWEIVRNPDGSERTRRMKKISDANISGEIPLKWTGVFVSKREAVRKFVFSTKLQLKHINGLTYDFLYAMASELEKRDCLMVMGGGKKANEPLVLRRGGLPQRGFLEGRTSGELYSLVLHLSNMELKAPIRSDDANGDES